MTDPTIRNNWARQEILQLYSKSLMDLLYQAHSIHRQFFNPNKIQGSTLITIKTGACPEDCAYCPQSARYKTGIQIEKMIPLEKVLESAKRAKANGATRFCMGAAYRNPKPKAIQPVLEMIKEVKKLGMETCVTLGMLTQEQAVALKEAGLDYYNHNLDTSPNYYPNIISTRTYQERLDTLEILRQANIKVCCGGIIGMGESIEDRLDLLRVLANQPTHPESVPINMLTRVKGTPLENEPDLDFSEFVRIICVARILMPKSYVRLSAGRIAMSEELQTLCFFAGANSIHYGEEKLFITDNPAAEKDKALLTKLGMQFLLQTQLDNQHAS